MRTLEEARQAMFEALPPLPVEWVPLREATGRVAAEPILAPIDLPGFDNSAMDGYAVRGADVAAATAAAPVRLRVAGQAAAGQAAVEPVPAGGCVRVFTGSPLPQGADAVVMQEDTRSEAGSVWVLAAARPGENVRRRGEDVARGAQVAASGTRLGPGLISLLAALGSERVRARRRPVVGVLATGSELVEPGRSLGPGQIYDSNRVSLALLLEGGGAVCRSYPLVADTLAGTRAALEKALTECDAVATSGGVSVGALDFVKPAFEHLGGRLEFWRVAMKPGKPFAFGRRGAKLLFGLPGNPVSAWVTLLLLVRPALWRWQGAQDLDLPAVRGLLGEPLSNPGDRRHFVRVRMDGQGRVWLAGAQGSHLLSNLARGNGLLEVPAGAVLPAGTVVPVRRWDF